MAKLKFAKLQLVKDGGRLEVFNYGPQNWRYLGHKDTNEFPDVLADAGFTEHQRVVILSEADFEQLTKDRPSAKS